MNNFLDWNDKKFNYAEKISSFLQCGELLYIGSQSSL